MIYLYPPPPATLNTFITNTIIKPIYLLLIIVLLIIVLPSFLQRRVSPTISERGGFVSPTPTITPVITLLPPVSEFKQRITKKFFGTYVTPQNSPVTPERFKGFHTGIDVEYGDVTVDVTVSAITDGQIIYSGHINGYGGFIAQKISLNSQDYIVIYGHLKQSSLVKTGTIVKQGESLGILGQGYTSETDGERKHLHLAFIKGNKLDFRGYVQNKSELSLWSDPLSFFP
jgi:murein DD-endopeptidase MepM/ murein hydrolase activator NlpD